MENGDTLARLADEAVLASFDRDLWEGWAVRAGTLLGGISTSLYVVDRHAASISFQCITHPNPRAIERYVEEEIFRLDPQIPYVASLPGDAIYRDTDHLDRDHPATREYLAWQTSNGNLRHYLSCKTALGDGTHVGGVSVHRAVADGATPDLSHRLMTALFPALRRALQLGFVHAGKLCASYWDGLLFERAEPALLLDERGCVLRLVPALEAIFAAGDGLDCRDGRLHAADPASGARLAALIARAVTAVRPDGGAVPVARRSGRAPYLVTAYPLPRMARMLAPCEAAALVTVIDPAHRDAVRDRWWREAFGLSARECELGAMLMAGHSVESAAAMMGTAEGTARVHLRHLLGKTGTSRQADLVRLLARF